MKKLLATLGAAILLLLAGTLPAQAHPTPGATRCDVSWFQMDANGETFYGKLYYCVTPTNRRQVWSVGGKIDPDDSQMRFEVHTPQTAWAWLFGNTTAYDYAAIEPHLDTKNAFLEVALENDGVRRTAVVNLP